MAERVRHPLFARMYQRVSVATERAGAAEHRQRLLAGLAGRVVEIGAGNGLNFTHYPTAVVQVLAVEPEPYLRARGAEAAARALVPIAVVDGTASTIRAENESMDFGVASLILCSVADPTAALAELHRVIRPGGELRFYEHVLADTERLARRQRQVDPIWTRFAGGCHINRDTRSAIENAGFAIVDCDRFRFAPCVTAKLAAPHILGRATRQ